LNKRHPDSERNSTPKLPKMIPTIRSIELDMIKNDTNLFMHIIFQLFPRKSSSVLFFGLVPYISLFIVETDNYLQKYLPLYGRSVSLKYSQIIESSRMRIKLFDDTEKRIDGMFELMRWIVDFNKEWAINRHKGFLSLLKKLLQDDLGIFAYDGHLIGSTHTGLLNLGYQKGDLPTTSKEISSVLGPLTKSVGEELGGYLGNLAKYPEFDPNNLDSNYFVYGIQDGRLGYKDAKAQKFFTSVFNGAGSEEVNFSLLLFLTTVNYSHYIFKNFLVGSPCSFFKMKFIMVYHLISSLEKLQNYCYPKNMFSTRSKEYLQELLHDKGLDLLKNQSKFRNILVHYALDDVPEKYLIPSKNLYGLVEHFFGGITYDELDEKLDREISRISVILEDWLDWKIKSSQFSSWHFDSV
jgi:hypothetical protein